jgi:mono/diheme cytochrome c family protein
MRKLAVITASFLGLVATTSPAWADAAAGKAVFDMKCRTCHGADGNGNPGIAKALGVTMKPLSSTDADVKKVVTEGMGKMKPVSGLTPAQADDVAAYVKSLKK